MKNILFILSFSTIIAQQTQTEILSEIYNSDKPLLQKLWSRSADLSNTLRSVEAIEFSKDGQYIVTGSKFGYDLMVWNTIDGTIVWKAKQMSEIECVAFSPDGKWVAAGDEDYELRIYEAPTGKLFKILKHDAALDGMAWSNDGKTVVTGTESGKIVVWNTDNWKKNKTINNGKVVNSLQFSKDDSKIIIGGDLILKDGTKGGFIRLYSTKDWSILKEFPLMKKPNKSARFSPDETTVVAASFDKTVKVYNASTGEIITTLPQPARSEAAIFHPSGKWLITGGIYRDIRIYDTKTWKQVEALPTVNTEYFDITKDGRLMVSAHERSGIISLYLFETDPNISTKFTKSVLQNKDLKN